MLSIPQPLSLSLHFPSKSLFNLLFTSAPVIAAGLLDRDLPRAVARASPHLYKATQAGTGLAPLALAGWAADALWHSAVCFGVPMLVLAVGPGGGPDGGPLGLWETSTLGFVLVVLVVNLRLILASRTLTAGHAASVAGSLAALVGYLAAYSAAPPALLSGIAPSGAMHGVTGRLVVCPAAWIALGLGTAAALLPDLVVVALRARGRGHAGSGGGAVAPATVPVSDAEGAVLTAKPLGLKTVKTGVPAPGSIQLTATSASTAPLLGCHTLGGPVAAGAPGPTPGSTPYTGYAFDHPGFESYFADRDAARKGAGGSGAHLHRQHGSASAASGGPAAPTALRPHLPSDHKRRRFSAMEAIALAARGLTGTTSSSGGASSRQGSRAEAAGAPGGAGNGGG